MTTLASVLRKMNVAVSMAVVAVAFAAVVSHTAVAQEATDAGVAQDEAAVGADMAAPADDAAAVSELDASQVAVPVVESKGDVAEVENPYGLGALWEQGDFVSRGTLMILVIMSMGTWYIMFTKLWEQHVIMKHAKTVAKNFWTAGSIQEGAGRLEKTSAYRGIVEDGLKATEHHEGKMTDQIDLHEWASMALQRSVEAINSRMQTGLSFLATVGSTAPFVGLFGTVWGIYHALIAIGLAGQASIDKVAGPVGEALIMTALGLAVAVPAVLSYNWLIRRNKTVMESVRNFSSDVHAYLLSGARVAKQATARSH